MAELERLNPPWALNWRGVVAAVFMIVFAIAQFSGNFSSGQCQAILVGISAAFAYQQWFPYPSADQKRWQEALKIMRVMNEEIKSLRAAQPH